MSQYPLSVLYFVVALTDCTCALFGYFGGYYYYYYTHVRVYVNSKSTYSHVPEDRQSGQGGKQK